MPKVYALQCEEGKYYIGKTDKDVNDRFQSHMNSRGSEWTKKYKAINLLEVNYFADEFDEDKLTKKYMARYGVNNVRGGSYVLVDLPEYQQHALKDELSTAKDLCYKCHGYGHYVAYCKVVSSTTITSNRSSPERHTPLVGNNESCNNMNSPTIFSSTSNGISLGSPNVTNNAINFGENKVTSTQSTPIQPITSNPFSEKVTANLFSSPTHSLNSANATTVNTLVPLSSNLSSQSVTTNSIQKNIDTSSPLPIRFGMTTPVSNTTVVKSIEANSTNLSTLFENEAIILSPPSLEKMSLNNTTSTSASTSTTTNINLKSPSTPIAVTPVTTTTATTTPIIKQVSTPTTITATTPTTTTTTTTMSIIRYKEEDEPPSNYYFKYCFCCGRNGHYLTQCTEIYDKKNNLIDNRMRTFKYKPCNRCGSITSATSPCTCTYSVQVKPFFKNKFCRRCGRDSHYVINCYASSDSEYTTILIPFSCKLCYICGRTSHVAEECFAGSKDYSSLEPSFNT